MDYTNYTTDSRKHKHLNLQERTIIELRLKDGYSAYKISKELQRPINTILNEIRRGTVPQIKNNHKIQLYFADAGQAIYKDHRTNCGRKNLRLVAMNSFLMLVTSFVRINGPLMPVLVDRWKVVSLNALKLFVQRLSITTLTKVFAI